MLPNEGKSPITQRATENMQSVMTLNTERTKAPPKIKMPLKDKIIMGPLDKY